MFAALCIKIYSERDPSHRVSHPLNMTLHQEDNLMPRCAWYLIYHVVNSVKSTLQVSTHAPQEYPQAGSGTHVDPIGRTRFPAIVVLEATGARAIGEEKLS